MASSLDEIQSYDLFQEELDMALDEYVLDFDKQLPIAYIGNAFIEFVSFNKFIDRVDQINNEVLKEFEIWLGYYNQEVNIEEAVEIVKEFITFFRNKGFIG